MWVGWIETVTNPHWHVNLPWSKFMVNRPCKGAVMTDNHAAGNYVARRRARRDLTGKHVLITGASSGIGRSAALAVAAKGAVVLLLARREDELAEAVREVREAGG